MEWLYHLFGQQSPRQRERAGYLKRIEHLNENILKLAGDRNTALAERDKLTKRMDAVTRERDELREQLDEALKAKPVTPTDGAVKKPRSRAKPQEKETTNDKEA